MQCKLGLELCEWVRRGAVASGTNVIGMCLLMCAGANTRTRAGVARVYSIYVGLRGCRARARIRPPGA